MSKSNHLNQVFDFVDVFQGRMDQLKWTRADLAKNTPISEGTLSKYWAHKQVPKLDAIIEISMALDLNLSILPNDNN